MTEEQWLASDDPQAMLAHLEEAAIALDCRYPSGRKLRLFACACCRQVWHLLTDPRSRRAVEVAERHADGQAAEAEIVEAGADASVARMRAHPVGMERWCVAYLASAVLGPDMPGEVPDALGAVQSTGDDVAATQAALLRDIAGNPWRPVVLRRPLPWIVTNLARAAYEERLPDGTLDPQRLAVLADALEEAGCVGEPLLMHLRGQERCPLYFGASGGPEDCRICGAARSVSHGWIRLRGPHVRGCWALDLCLGRE